MKRTQGAGHESLFKIGVANQALFGKPLEEAIRQSNGQIPQPIQMCCNVIEENIETEGIYKVNVATRKPEEYSRKVDTNQNKMDDRDVHEVASLLKGFLNRLPVPLCLPTSYPQFVSAHAIRNVDTRFQKIKNLFNGLPNANKMVLLHLLRHLHKVAQHTKKNKMTVSSLATTFAPVIFKCPKELDSPLRVMTDQPALAAVLATLISYHHLLLLSQEATPSLMPLLQSDGDALAQMKAIGHSDAMKRSNQVSSSPSHPNGSSQPRQAQFMGDPTPTSTHSNMQPYPPNQSQHGASSSAIPHLVVEDPFWSTVTSSGGLPLPPTSPSMANSLAPPTLLGTRGGNTSPSLSPRSVSNYDPNTNHTLESLLSETCQGNLAITPWFECIPGGPTAMAEFEQCQKEQNARVASVFGASYFDRLSSILRQAKVSELGMRTSDGMSHYKPPNSAQIHETRDPVPQAPPQPHPYKEEAAALAASDASSSESSDSDDYSSHATALHDTPGFLQAQGIATPNMIAQGMGNQAQMKRKVRQGQVGRVNEKLLTRELNEEIPINLTSPYNCLMQRLNRRRTRSNRPSHPTEMTLEQMKDEKRSIKMELKNFDGLFQTTFNRAPQKRDKEPLREIYAMYKLIKRAIEDQEKLARGAGGGSQVPRRPIELGKEAPLQSSLEPKGVPRQPLAQSYAPNALNPQALATQAPASHGMDLENYSTSTSGPGIRRWAGSEVEPTLAGQTQASKAPVGTNNISDVGKSASSGPMSQKGFTASEVRNLKQEKRELKKKLCHFQNKFRDEFQRDVVSKKDREPMHAEYERYRELKTLLRDIEGPTGSI